MINSLVIVALWLANQIDPKILVVANESTACAIVQRATKTPGNYDTNDISAYIVYPELVGVSVMVKLERLTCPKEIKLTEFLSMTELDEIDRKFGRSCRTHADKKNWKSYFFKR